MKSGRHILWNSCLVPFNGLFHCGTFTALPLLPLLHGYVTSLTVILTSIDDRRSTKQYCFDSVVATQDVITEV